MSSELGASRRSGRGSEGVLPTRCARPALRPHSPTTATPTITRFLAAGYCCNRKLHSLLNIYDFVLPNFRC